jgi:ABC-2 type transport system ATP-binding protein
MADGRILVVDTPQGLRGRVTRPVWEVELRDPFRAAEAVEAALPGASVQLFGDRLHVVHEVDEPALRAILDAAGHPSEIRRVPPSLEDAYVQIVQEQTAEVAS